MNGTEPVLSAREKKQLEAMRARAPRIDARPRKVRSAAARRLRAWRLASKLPSWRAAGLVLGVPWHRYRRWELGECVPLAEDAMRIEKAIGIARAEWYA